MMTNEDPLVFDYVESDIQNRQQTLPLKKYDVVAVIGVGGIGSWVAFDLALTGKIKKLYMFDPDMVESTNLNRTPFKIADVGRYKVDALFNLIAERRLDCDVEYFRDEFKKKMLDPVMMTEKTCIVDCRDDIFKDLRSYDCKIWKIGYDGLSITIDGNPKNTRVWGRSNGYATVPSFVCSSQLAANLVVNHILMEYNPLFVDHPCMDKQGTFNSILTFDSSALIYDLYNMQHPEAVGKRSRKGVLRDGR